jgi:hypothetical protein
MRATLSDGVEFEVPDVWFQKAGMLNFVRATPSYRSGPHPDHPDYPMQIVPIGQIKPVRRNPSVTLDFGGFVEDRMIGILEGFVLDNSIPPIKVSESDDPRYPYQVYDGKVSPIDARGGRWMCEPRSCPFQNWPNYAGEVAPATVWAIARRILSASAPFPASCWASMRSNCLSV